MIDFLYQQCNNVLMPSSSPYLIVYYRSLVIDQFTLYIIYYLNFSVVVIDGFVFDDDIIYGIIVLKPVAL